MPTVLVTGGARRIGAVIATAFAHAGWDVVIHANRSIAAAQELARALPNTQTVSCDLADAAAIAAMITAIAARTADWRVLINSAAVFQPDGAEAIDPGVFAQAMAINAAAPVQLAQQFLAHARAAGGRRVIQITDQKLANPNPDFFSYSLSKHALGASVPMLAVAGEDPRDRVYAIAPGAILASFDQTDAEAERSHRLNLLRRRTDAREIAAAALFLADGWLASGSTLFIDSGQHLLAQPRDVMFLAREADAPTPPVLP